MNFYKTKIVATIGPSSNDEKTLLKMIKSGMNVARLNFSHGNYETHKKTIDLIRKISEHEDLAVSILQDLSGPKIRLSEMENPVNLKKNDMIRISIDKSVEAELYTDFEKLPHYVKSGDKILIDDGYIELKVKNVKKRVIEAKVVQGGIAKSKKGINLPDISVNIPVFTEKDKRDLEFGLDNDVDIIAMSFVSCARDIIPIRKMISKRSKNIPVIAKIERPMALKNADKILDAFDGIMVARGDLGVEMALEKIPLIQKDLILRANNKNKIVITATQMLESMINNPRPTRAEASDVSNAILDGSDAIMLSGETASGKFPVKAVKTMRNIAEITEKSPLYDYAITMPHSTKIGNTEAIVKSAAIMSEELDAKFILVFTYSGNTALLLSKYRPKCPIIAFSPQKDVVRRMGIYWGVEPYYIEFIRNTDEMILKGEDMLRIKKIVKPGDLILTIAGLTPMKGATNMLRVSKIN